MEKCTYPGCNYQRDYILSTHHTIPEHNMTRQEVQKKYGNFTQSMLINSLKSKWIREQSQPLSNNAFDRLITTRWKDNLTHPYNIHNMKEITNE